MLMALLYPKPDINDKINTLRKNASAQFDSLSKSLAAQNKRNAYIKYLIENNRNLTLAQQLVDSDLMNTPKDEYYLVLKGQIFAARMQYDSALLEYNLAMQRDSFPYALEEQAKTFIKLGKYDLAIADYRTAFNRNYDYSYLLATLFDSLQRKDSAIKYYLIFTNHYPDPVIEKRIIILRK